MSSRLVLNRLGNEYWACAASRLQPSMAQSAEIMSRWRSFDTRADSLDPTSGLILPQKLNGEQDRR